MFTNLVTKLSNLREFRSVFSILDNVILLLSTTISSSVIGIKQLFCYGFGLRDRCIQHRNGQWLLSEALEILRLSVLSRPRQDTTLSDSGRGCSDPWTLVTAAKLYNIIKFNLLLLYLWDGVWLLTNFTRNGEYTVLYTVKTVQIIYTRTVW